MSKCTVCGLDVCEDWDPKVCLPIGTRCYLSGPMSGIEDHNYPMFNSVAKKLRQQNLVVYNPAENFGGRLGLPRAEYMRVDLVHLLQSQAILLLPGWRDSTGARLEWDIANELEIEAIELTADHGLLPKEGTNEHSNSNDPK